MRVEVRGGPGATTGQERVPNAAYAVLQRCPGEERDPDLGSYRGFLGLL